MARIKTQADFVVKAKEIHGDYYDYSLVEYHKSNEKVKIVCPVHGVFEQTPNKHLVGQGCKVCGKNRTRVGCEVFIERAIKVHGDKYDYSKVVYTRTDEKVCIVCPIHGEFYQTPHCHVVLKQNCPQCAAIEAGQKRRGENNVMRKESVKAKVRQTCLRRYGTKTYSESVEGRQRLHDIISDSDVQTKIKQTCLNRYGVPSWAQSDEGKYVLHTMMSSEAVKQRVVDGYIAKYGVDHYMKTEEGRKKLQESMLDVEHQHNARQGLIDKYGVHAAALIPGVNEKAWATKRRNGTFNTSKPEETLYGLLCDVFGCEDIVRQYFDEARYPFHCDFYIKSLNMFVELNASWTHGAHWFDETNPDDVALLAEWKRRALQKGSYYYQQAIDMWTVRDLHKRAIAEKNHLNYFVFWKQDLSDARAWLEAYR